MKWKQTRSVRMNESSDDEWLEAYLEKNPDALEKMLKWVKTKQPEKSEAEQERFAKNILKKKHREGKLHNDVSEKPKADGGRAASPQDEARFCKEIKDYEKTSSGKVRKSRWLVPEELRFSKSDLRAGKVEFNFYKPVGFDEDGAVQLDVYACKFAGKSSYDDGDYDDGQLHSWTVVDVGYAVDDHRKVGETTGELKDGKIVLSSGKVLNGSSNKVSWGWHENDVWEPAPRHGGYYESESQFGGEPMFHDGQTVIYNDMEFKVLDSNFDKVTEEFTYVLANVDDEDDVWEDIPEREICPRYGKNSHLDESKGRIGGKTDMRKLNVTKRQFVESKHLQRKYGKLKYVSESGRLYKTDKGNVLKFNESNNSGKDMEREFEYKGVVVTRYDYESLPDPMVATELDDETMQKIAKDTHDYLCDGGWSQEEIDKYLSNGPDEIYDDDPMGEGIQSDFWKYMEKAAIRNGMQYYEDMDDAQKTMESAPGVDSQQMDFLEKIGDYLMADFGIEDIDDYKFGPRIYFNFKGKNYYVEVGYSDSQPVDESSEDVPNNWFDYHGELVKPLPGDCVMACSGSGQKDSDVEFWVKELKFDAGLPRGRTIRCLRQYGAWDEDELEAMSDTELAEKVLWIFCNDLREQAYDMVGEDEELAEKLGDDPSAWDDQAWEEFQNQYGICSLNN